MKYQELIPETNILALIVNEIICSGLNQNYKYDFNYHIDFLIFMIFVKVK